MRGTTSSAHNGLAHVVSPVLIAAHELKAPLSLIRQLGYELANDQCSDEERARMVHQIVLVSERSLRLTSNVTRADALQRSLFPLEPVNSIDIVRDVCHELQPLYALHERTIRITRSHQLPPVVANRDLLRRIMANFADNALHYGNGEGVVELRANLSRKRDTVRLSVRDYGPALPKKRWEHLIRSLRGRQPVHARPQSSGLGIYISHQFAESMNGRIGAMRHRDGASFYVELPVSRQLSLL